MDRYAAEVQARFQLTVPVFEELVRQRLLEEKFRKRVTDGISVGPGELQDEFKVQKRKDKIELCGDQARRSGHQDQSERGRN